MREQEWFIPSTYDMGEVAMRGAKPIELQVVLNIKGGTMPEHHAYLLSFPRIRLDKPGQMQMLVESDEDPDELLQALMRKDDKVRSTPPKLVSMRLEKGLLVPDQDGQIYTQEIKTW